MAGETQKQGKALVLKKALVCAFPKTVPIMMGFLFLGMSYGLYMKVSGFSFIYPLCMSLIIFGGSLEFVTVTVLLGSFAPLQTFFMALLIQIRHLFYGIALLEKYGNMGKKKFYLIFGLCDESFSVNYSLEIPEGTDRGWCYFFVTLLNHLYWVTGATLGGILGGFVKFNTEGLEFVMTAMFVVIFLEQWRKEKRHYSSYIGLFVSVVCLLLFGAKAFLIPTMICILCFLTFFRKPIEKAEETV